MTQPSVFGLNKANAKIGIDITATKMSDILRNMKRILERVFFNLKTRRHKRILLTTIMAAEVKQYITFSGAMLAISADTSPC